MKPIYIKKLLISEINKVASEPHNYCTNPDTDFTRNRKLSMEKMLQGIIGMESKSLTNELLDLFDASAETPSASAFIQQRDKIRPIAFESIFKNFSKKLMNSFDNDIPVFAIDGSDIQIPTNPTDTESYIAGTNGHKGYNLLHINALYDLNKHIYSDVIIQKARERNEHKAFQELVDCSEITKALIIADRGYESFNSMAHIQEKGWFFLIRVRDGNNGIKQGLDLPEFDFLPLKNKKAEPTRFYELNFRIVRFPISEDIYETVVTNLDEDRYPAIEIKKLYASRWGIETSFRDLKYTVGLLNFHSKKVMCILQEIYAHMIMYNFAEMITSHVAIEKKQRKYTYKANFSVATHICRLFYREKTTPPDLEAIIAKNLIPIRPDRHRERNVKAKIFQGFLYRVA